MSGRTHNVARKRKFSEFILLGSLALVALSAIPAGLMLAAAPDGRLLGMSLELLSASPFSTFLIPGCVLATLVGGSSLAAFFLFWNRHPLARAAILGSGLVLTGWIIVQAFWIGALSFLQPGMLVVGLALIWASLSRSSEIP
jgi:hypothetical protein